VVADDQSAAGFREMVNTDRADRIPQSGEEQSENAEDILRQHAHSQKRRREHDNCERHKLLRGGEVKDRSGEPMHTDCQDAGDA